MITLAIIAILALAFLAFACLTAPTGWEDENGWHAGSPGEGGSTHNRSNPSSEARNHG